MKESNDIVTVTLTAVNDSPQLKKLAEAVEKELNYPINQSYESLESYFKEIESSIKVVE